MKAFAIVMVGALALMLTACNGRSASPENSSNQGGDISTKGVPMAFQNINPDPISLHTK
ncbi:hypothetical protein [Paenibacillus kribbensis]|uniref:hypothetical protein n=1 Tax=Paenibacillus kribbensis TaxID=172713 RepID=UPI00159F12C8|nr:hypothetical protein [Paenibacillus kribbensis]